MYLQFYISKLKCISLYLCVHVYQYAWMYSCASKSGSSFLISLDVWSRRLSFLSLPSEIRHRHKKKNLPSEIFTFLHYLRLYLRISSIFYNGCLSSLLNINCFAYLGSFSAMAIRSASGSLAMIKGLLAASAVCIASVCTKTTEMCQDNIPDKCTALIKSFCDAR